MGYILTNDAIAYLVCNKNGDVWDELKEELSCCTRSLNDWIEGNKPNNNLTKAAAVDIIANNSGLTEDQILKSDV